jgi:hypothetical protein
MLHEAYGLKLFEYRVLRKIFGPMWEEGTQSCGKLHNDELQDLCSSYCEQIKEDEIGRKCGTQGI